MTDTVKAVALAICKSRTCEGVSCCQWPANMGRTNCNAKNGAYDDAARAAIAVLSSDVAVAAREPTDQELAGWARNWHWNDCADDRPVDPSIYFRDMRMLKAFVDKFASTVSRPHHQTQEEK